MFYDTYSISKGEKKNKYFRRLKILRFRVFGNMYRAKTYSCPGVEKRANVTPIQGNLLKQGQKIHYKRYSFKFISQVLAVKIINNTTINEYYASKII